jgi:hypothetical protein
MVEAWELFHNLEKRDLDIHVQLGDDEKYVEGEIMFHLESGGSLDVQNVIYVPCLKNNFISV